MPKLNKVSVSLRSYIHSYAGVNVEWTEVFRPGFRLLTELYSFLPKIVDDMIVISAYLVSVSLRSYIHSYIKFILNLIRFACYSFRLLTELYSFLRVVSSFTDNSLIKCFRLLTELYSFLPLAEKELQELE